MTAPFTCFVRLGSLIDGGWTTPESPGAAMDYSLAVLDSTGVTQTVFGVNATAWPQTWGAQTYLHLSDTLAEVQANVEADIKSSIDGNGPGPTFDVDGLTSENVTFVWI